MRARALANGGAGECAADRCTLTAYVASRQKDRTNASLPALPSKRLSAKNIVRDEQVAAMRKDSQPELRAEETVKSTYNPGSNRGNENFPVDGHCGYGGVSEIQAVKE